MTNATTTTFETGTTYYTRSIADYDCIVTFKIVRRTAKSVWVSDWRDRTGETIVRRSVKSYGEYETFADGSWHVASNDVLPEGGVRELRSY